MGNSSSTHRRSRAASRRPPSSSTPGPAGLPDSGETPRARRWPPLLTRLQSAAAGVWAALWRAAPPAARPPRPFPTCFTARTEHTHTHTQPVSAGRIRGGFLLRAELQTLGVNSQRIAAQIMRSVTDLTRNGLMEGLKVRPGSRESAKHTHTE